MNPDNSAEDYEKPVAYDANGRPLYARPQVQEPQQVHIVRPSEPIKQDVSPELKLKHDKSVRMYPTLNLSENEYVISAVRRHLIGLFLPFAAAIILLALGLSALINFDVVVTMFGLTGVAADPSTASGFILLFCALVLFGAYIAYYVFTNNRFYLTNESVIQELQISLFARHEQTVSLGNIEDASYQQNGIIQQLIGYGSIRLSTEGDETTYRFTYVANPKEHIATLNNAVEAFKNGRPVDED
jgi:uncharacterized membrane protein YdbT with pleckstrin-like domain